MQSEIVNKTLNNVSISQEEMKSGHIRNIRSASPTVTTDATAAAANTNNDIN